VHVIAHNGAPEFGGAEIATCRLLAGLQQRGHRILLCCNNTLVAGWAGEYGVPTVVLPLGGDVMLPHAMRFARFLRKRSPDAVLLGTFRKLWLGGLGARIAGVPWVVARIGLSTDIARNVKYRFTLRHCVDAVVLKDHEMRGPFLAGLPEVDPRRVVTIQSGVPTPERAAPPGAVRRALNLPASMQVIGAVARLVKQKRFDRLLYALAALPEHVHCVLAGEGEERPALEQLAQELGLQSRVHLLGWRNDVGDVLDALDVFVVSSDRESMCNAMVEAMAAGVPVVSTRVSGAVEALAPNSEGEAAGEVVGFDVAELSACLSRLLADPMRRRCMANAAARRARECYGLERLIDQWETVLAGDLRFVGTGSAPPAVGE
jgi:glycosyltransferase involved in cell wall biosynthesis